MVSALLSLSSYVLGPDMIALDVKSHSASDGESDIILRRMTNIACGGLNVQVLASFPVWTYVCMNTVTQHLSSCATIAPPKHLTLTPPRRQQLRAPTLPETHDLQTCHTTDTKVSNEEVFSASMSQRFHFIIAFAFV